MRPGASLLLLLCGGCFDRYDKYHGPVLGGPPPSPALTFHVQPGPTIERAAISPAIQVWLIDYTGRLIPNAIDSVAIRIGANPAGGTLSGTTIVPAENATATFANLSLDRRGEGYTLNVSAPGYPGFVSAPFNVSCSCWSTKAALPTFRYEFGIGVVNGILYVVGGRDPQGRVLSTVEAYDPLTNTWSTKASMPTPRDALGIGVVDGVLYAIGGRGLYGRPLAVVEAYNPVTDAWTLMAPMPAPNSMFGVGVVGGVVYAIGGNNYSDGSGLGTVEAYDPLANSWTPQPSMPTPRFSLDVGVVDGIIYAVGGYARGNATVEAYDPVSHTWTTKAPIPTPRYWLGAGVVNRTLYAIGGYTYAVGGYTGRPRATVEAYDPVANAWTPRGPMPTSRGDLGIGVVNGVLYALGGLDFGGGGTLTTVEAYDPAEEQ